MTHLERGERQRERQRERERERERERGREAGRSRKRGWGGRGRVVGEKLCFFRFYLRILGRGGEEGVPKKRNRYIQHERGLGEEQRD